MSLKEDQKIAQEAVKKLKAKKLVPYHTWIEQQEIKKEKKRLETSKQRFIQKYVKAGLPEEVAKLLWNDFAKKSDTGHDHHMTWAR